MKLMSIAGARPNFMKLAALAKAVTKHNESGILPLIHHIIVHTGQHYDEKMSKSFFEELSIPKPDINLEVGSGTHAQQLAEIMKRFEPVLLAEQPDVLLVVGDVNSTIACTLVASKIEYPPTRGRKRPILVHVESGLRSFDRDMPEEINRILTDALSDLLFVTEQSGVDNLLREGVDENNIHFVGNVMIDTLIQHLEKARQSDIKKRLGIPTRYGLVTLHRPSNVDRKEVLEPLVECVEQIAEQIFLVFPVHPRTFSKLAEFSLMDRLQTNSNILVTEPLGYLNFLNLTQTANVIITDSGGIQEETTYLGVPCVTLRENTERPVTITEGTNYLLKGTDYSKILATVSQILDGNTKKATIPKLWDGKAGERIIETLVNAAHS